MSKATYADLVDHLEAALRIARRMEDPQNRSALEHASLHRRMVEAYDQSLELAERVQAGVDTPGAVQQKQAEASLEAQPDAAQKPADKSEEAQQEESLAKEEIRMRQDDVRTEQNSQYHQPESVYLGAQLPDDQPGGEKPQKEENQKEEDLKVHAEESQVTDEAMEEPHDETASKDAPSTTGVSPEKHTLSESERQRRRELLRKKKARKKAKLLKERRAQDSNQASGMAEVPVKPVATPEDVPAAPREDFTDRLSQAANEPPAPGRHLYETFSRSQSSLNERLSSDQDKRDGALAEKLKHRPVEDLTRAITLNERIRFIRELFRGDAEAFRSALEQLNKVEHWEQARRIIDEQLQRGYQWPEDSQAAGLFRALVRRKFIADS